MFTYSCRPDRLWGPPNLLYDEYRGLFLGVKRPGREADHSPRTSAEVKKMWIYTSTPPYVFMAQCLISYAQGELFLTLELNYTSRSYNSLVRDS
jgi:hypothetical protein